MAEELLMRLFKLLVLMLIAAAVLVLVFPETRYSRNVHRLYTAGRIVSFPAGTPANISYTSPYATAIDAFTFLASWNLIFDTEYHATQPDKMSLLYRATTDEIAPVPCTTNHTLARCRQLFGDNVTVLYQDNLEFLLFCMWDSKIIISVPYNASESIPPPYFCNTTEPDTTCDPDVHGMLPRANWSEVIGPASFQQALEPTSLRIQIYTLPNALYVGDGPTITKINNVSVTPFPLFSDSTHTVPNTLNGTLLFTVDNLLEPEWKVTTLLVYPVKPGICD